LAVPGKPGLRSTRSAQTTAGRASGSPLERRELDRLLNAFAHFLAGLEVRNIFLGYRNGLRIRVFGSQASAEWLQTEPEDLRLSHADGRHVLIMLAGGVHELLLRADTLTWELRELPGSRRAA